MYGKNVNLHWKSSKFSLALQPEALVNTSGRVDFSSPDLLTFFSSIYCNKTTVFSYFDFLKKKSIFQRDSLVPIMEIAVKLPFNFKFLIANKNVTHLY